MTIYIIRNNFYELVSSFTDCVQANKECNSMNALAGPYVMFNIVKLELIVDDFMELPLQPHKPKPFKDFL